MMTQNEFKEKIELYLESLIEIKKQCDEKRLNCPKTIIECIGWIKEILVELRYGNIPEPFYERILTHSFDFLVSMLQMAKDVLAGSTVEKGLEGIEKYFS